MPGLELGRETSLSPCSSDSTELPGIWLGFMAGVELGMHGGVILSVCTAGAGKSLANNVRLILVACEGLIRLRLLKVPKLLNPPLHGSLLNLFQCKHIDGKVPFL